MQINKEIRHKQNLLSAIKSSINIHHRLISNITLYSSFLCYFEASINDLFNPELISDVTYFEIFNG
jgi:hypothetical protein